MSDTPAINSILEKLQNSTSFPQLTITHFQTAVEYSYNPVFITDPDGISVYVNQAVEKVTGFTKEEIIGKKAGARDLWGGQMSLSFYQTLWDTIKVQKRNFSAEIVNKRKNGELYSSLLYITPSLNASGGVEFFVCTEQDISEQKIAEEQITKVLTDLEERSQTIAQDKVRAESLLKSIGDGIVATDQDGRVTVMNLSAQKMLGWSEEEVMGKPVIEVLKLVDEKGVPLPLSQRPMILALSTGQNASLPVNKTYLLVRKDGSQFAVGISVAPFVLNNKIIGTIEVFRDISIEKSIDKAKTEFVSLASHQLRTPLSAISWYTEMLSDGLAGELQPKQQEFLQTISISNQRMISLVDSLLNVSRVELGTFVIEPETVDMIPLIESVLAELVPRITTKKITVVKEYKEEKIELQADIKLLTIIFQNLLSNAVKYNKDNGTVTIVAEKTDTNYLFKVSDTGLGIPHKDYSQIFQKLFRAENVRITETEGTGLGLYLVKAIVETCKGSVEFESEENKGSTFTVKLPLVGMVKKEGTRTLK